MRYEYDVFISYRRHERWPHWVQNRFLPILKHWLGEEIPTLRIAWDVDVEEGRDWPVVLADRLSASRIMVPLLSRQYFSSRWCKSEMGLMLAREKECHFGTDANSQRLIVPAIIHDGEYLPHFISKIQSLKLQDYSNAWVTDGSLTLERLSEEIRRWALPVAEAARSAPERDPYWRELAVNEFVAQFEVPSLRQSTSPSLG